MKKQETVKTVKLVLILVFCFSSAFLIYSYIYLSTINPTLREPAMKELVSKVLHACKKENFGKGVFSDDIVIKGPEKDENLEKILSIELTSGLIQPEDSPFSMVVAINKYSDWATQLRENLLKKGYTVEQIWPIIQKLRKEAKPVPDYFVELEWFWVKGKEKKLLNLCCTISKGQQRIPAQSVVLAYPEFERRFIEKRKVLIVGNKIFSSSAGMSFLILSVLYIQFFILKRKTVKNLPVIIENLQKYVETGRYVASYELLNNALYYLPDNTDLIAIKSRLDVVTRKNYHEAEKAYTRFVNLKLKLEKTGLLTEEEYDELAKLPQYLDLPEINILVGLCQKRISMLKLNKTIREKMAEVNALISNGKLEQARIKLYELEKEPSWNEYLVAMKEQQTEEIKLLSLPAPQNFVDLKAEIEQKITKSKENVEKAKECIVNGDIRQAKMLLDEAVNINNELDEAKELIKRIKKSEDTTVLKFIPEKVGKEIVVFKKDTITIFRKDKLTPDIDINNLRVSRDRHLKISIVENKVIAEDQNSTNGTYHRGQKITRAEIEDGDIIDLAHAYRITVHICRGREIVQSTLVSGTIPAEMQIGKQEIEEHQKVSGLFIEADDKNYIVLPPKSTKSEVNIAFKPVGIVYEKSGNCKLSVCDNVFLLYTPEEGYRLVCAGEEVEYHGVRYKVVPV